MIFSASSFFAVLQSSLNQIWEVKPKPENSLLKMILERTLPFGIVLVLAIFYKFLPDACVRWRVVWMGAIITAFLFMIGRLAISLYLSQTSMTDAYGVAGALVLILLWIFYSALILFYGAEVTQQYAIYFGEEIKPKAHAVRIKAEEVPPDHTSEKHPKTEG